MSAAKRATIAAVIELLATEFPRRFSVYEARRAATLEALMYSLRERVVHIANAGFGVSVVAV
jgi:hypothetical protein